MLYRPALHGNWNALSLARRGLKDKFPTPTVPLTAVLSNHRVFLPEPIEIQTGTVSSWQYSLWPHVRMLMLCLLFRNMKITSVSWNRGFWCTNKSWFLQSEYFLKHINLKWLFYMCTEVMQKCQAWYLTSLETNQSLPSSMIPPFITCLCPPRE
jgi:hypothetical protein